jgi:hypothetical protein
VASSGTYSQTVVEPDTETGAATTDTMTESANFSGLLTLNSYDPGPLTYAFAAPASNNINVTINDANTNPPVVNTVIPIPGWMPVQASPSLETDTISASSLDPSCAPSTTFGGTPMLIAQTVKVIDVVNGTFETRTTKTYDISGVGTVCTVYSDVIQTFYDYSGQEGPYLIAFSATGQQPILQTTVTETLSLKTSNVAQVDAAKRSQSVGAVALFPASLVSGHVQYVARARQAAKIAAFRMKNGQLLRAGVVK